MFISKPKTFHEVIKPLVYFNCFVGMGALRQPNQTATVYFFMTLQTVIATLMNWTMIYIMFTSIAEILDFDDTSLMNLVMYKTLVSVNSSITLFAPLLVLLQRQGLRICLRQMPILDETFQAVLGVQKKYKKQYIRINCKIIAIVLVMFLVAVCDNVFSLEIELQLNGKSVIMFISTAIALHHPILIMLLLDVNFCTFVGYLGNKFRDLNDSLIGLTEKPFAYRPDERLFVISRNVIKSKPGDRVKNAENEDLINNRRYLLREIRKGHSELCKLSRQINLTFGIQNLLSTGVAFVMITGLLYTIYSAFLAKNFNTNRLKEIIPSAIWAVIYAFKIWIVNHSCGGVSNEAARTGEVIYDLLNSRLDEALDKEINGFVVQMLKNPVNFNACGFFTLDYTFVQGVIGSITTYLIILIQMSSIAESTISRFLRNNTGI